MNNYERIKAMSIEEMAECMDLLKCSDCGISDFDECPSCIIYGLCQRIGKTGIKKWLESEVE